MERGTSRLQVQGPDQIEKEALAFTWACKSLSDYLIGLRFHIETYHKPLVPLFSPKKGLDELPLRLQRFRLRMLRYSSISHVPSKSPAVADTYIDPQQFQHQLTRNFRETLSLMSPASLVTSQLQRDEWLRSSGISKKMRQTADRVLPRPVACKTES